jgi:hypothetical protein
MDYQTPTFISVTVSKKGEISATAHISKEAARLWLEKLLKADETYDDDDVIYNLAVFSVSSISGDTVLEELEW